MVHKVFHNSTIFLVINILSTYFYSFPLTSLGLCYILNPLGYESHQIRNTTMRKISCNWSKKKQ